MNRYYMRRGKLPFGYLFLAGILSGILIMNFGKSILLENTGLLDEYTLYHMKYMTVDSSALFCYILCLRLKTVVALVILATTYLGLAVCAGMAYWYGLSAGAFVSAAVIRYGLKGILFFLVSILPQCLIYMPAFAALLLWCEALNRNIYFANHQKHPLVAEGKNLSWMKKAIQLIIILAILLLGCLLESFVNPGLMKKLLRTF